MRPRRPARLAVDIAKSLLLPEAAIGDGVALAATETLAEVVVVLEYTTGAMAGAL